MPFICIPTRGGWTWGASKWYGTMILELDVLKYYTGAAQLSY